MLVSRPALSQERGAIALGEAVLGLGVNTRVLVIGAHPDDEDTYLISWLSRGRHVETAYLSLTRGDGGQNLIGNELGEALGVIRTEELLAARRVDGAAQYFTRAYDFGFSKDTVDTYKHWPKDSILGDVVRVVRAFRPHVIVSVFSGTTRDGHGHHQVAGLLSREAYDVAADTLRYPVPAYGAAWTPLKLYRSARFNQQSGTLSFDAGEYSPLLGRSYAEIAGESRSQHKSQGFGALQRKGPLLGYLRREVSRVNGDAPASSEQSLFDGIDTSWARFRGAVTDPRSRAALDSLPKAFSAVRAAFDAFAPERLIAPLGLARRLLGAVCRPEPVSACGRIEQRSGTLSRTIRNADLVASLETASARLERAMQLASGITIETNAVEVMPLGMRAGVLVTIYNRGRDTVAVGGGISTGEPVTPATRTRLIPPGGFLRDTLGVRLTSVSQPWWLNAGRSGGMFNLPGSGVADNQRSGDARIMYTVDLGGASLGEMLTFVEPISNLVVDQVRGELRYASVGAPVVAVRVDQALQYAPANADIDRQVEVHVRSADEAARDVRVSLALPPGLTADSAARSVRLERYDARGSATFRVRGRVAAGEHSIAATAQSGSERFRAGYQLIDYDHIRRQRIYRPATTTVVAVDVRVPANLRVAYVPGVSDNVAPMLAQLGVPVTVIPAAEVVRADLAPYTTVVVGPRAYDAHPELAAANPRLFDFARRGGTLVVQYGQYEMTQPGIMPHAIAINRPHDRVTHEDAPVTMVDASARELTWPNRIGAADFDGWVQERALYMPRTFDGRYRALLAMNDPGESPNRGAVLVAPVGDGIYVYTTLALFRQLPAGVPGAARLFVNLLSAGLDAPRTNP